METKHKYFTEYPESIITKHFDISDNGVIIDLITPEGVYYLEFDNKHKCTEFTEWLCLSNISPAEKGIPGESIQGTYKG